MLQIMKTLKFVSLRVRFDINFGSCWHKPMQKNYSQHNKSDLQRLCIWER